MDFITFEQSQASCFALFPVFMLSYANRLLAVASYLTDMRVASILSSNFQQKDSIIE